MKASRKLIPAFAMLLVALVVMSTASYAWFSMNTQVSATGMQVTAQAPTSLLISNTDATSGFGSTVALANDVTGAAAKFAPVAYAGEAEAWFKLTTAAMANINQDGRAVGFTEIADRSDVADFTGEKIGEANVYEEGGLNIFHDVVWLKVEGKENQKVTATLAYKSPFPSDEIKTAMHVVFVVNDEIVAEVDMGAASLTTGDLATLTANDEATEVHIYYFLSGNDENCKNVYISADATMSIDITFNAANVG